jgi:uncharacterized protein YkwD
MNRFIKLSDLVKFIADIIKYLSRKKPIPPEPKPIPTPEPPPKPTPIPPPEPTPEPTPKTPTELAIDQLLSSHNKLRQTPLTINTKLTAAAQKHAEWMAFNNTLSHVGDKRSQPWTRTSWEGYENGFVGENIAFAYSLDQVMPMWLQSQGHRRNILDSNYKNIGIGIKNNYYCVVFGGGD